MEMGHLPPAFEPTRKFRVLINVDETSVRLVPQEGKGHVSKSAYRLLCSGMPLGRNASLAAQRSAISHVAAICDHPEIQKRLPQVVLVGENQFTEGRAKTCSRSSACAITRRLLVASATPRRTKETTRMRSLFQMILVRVPAVLLRRRPLRSLFVRSHAAAEPTDSMPLGRLAGHRLKGEWRFSDSVALYTLDHHIGEQSLFVHRTEFRTAGCRD